MSKAQPRRNTKARAKWYPGLRRGARPLIERLTQPQLLHRAERQLMRAGAAVEQAPKAERQLLQKHLANIRARLVVVVGEQAYVRTRLSHRR